MEEEDEIELPPLTKLYRQILAKYPDGGQILKVRQYYWMFCFDFDL